MFRVSGYGMLDNRDGGVKLDNAYTDLVKIDFRHAVLKFELLPDRCLSLS